MPENQLLNVRPRVDSVDLLRGAVMVLMALDHVRDFFSDTVFKFDPTDLTQTTPGLFFTRWVTHFCAPVFVFLAGTGAYLSGSRGKTKGELSRFLITRGVFLILLDPIVIRHSWFWDFNWRFTFGQVIWAIGWSMVVLAGLIHLPRWFGAAFGVAMIAGHNLLDGIKPEELGGWGMLWNLLHVQGFVEPVTGFQFFVIYPVDSMDWSDGRRIRIRRDAPPRFRETPSANVRSRLGSDGGVHRPPRGQRVRRRAPLVAPEGWPVHLPVVPELR